jgi:hypothetical protein
MSMKALVLRTSLAVLLLAPAAHALTLDQTIGGCGGLAPERTIQATPSTYKSLLGTLKPGDRLQLAAGTYTQQLVVWNLNGAANRCIVFEGPASGAPALFTGGDVYNTISLKNNSYLVFRNLSLDGLGKLGDGVKSESGSTYAHHITLDNLKLKGYGADMQRCGISTKSKAWNWVIRRVEIRNAGVGMYLGNSNGTGEFVNGLIENNLILDSRLYDVQIKHQLGRDTAIGIPATGTTILRYNVFGKELNGATGVDARPNVLVGHWPLSGAGSTDIYQIYSNLFWLNPTEALFQGEGNIAMHDNLFVQRTAGGRAIRIQKHNNTPRRIDLFNNTVVSAGEGIVISGADPAYPQRVRGNAVFAGAGAATAISGGQQASNLIGAYSAAGQSLNNPGGSLSATGSTLDLYPKAGKLGGAAIDLSFATGLLDAGLDFNKLPRLSSFRGAYSGDTVNPGWQPAAAIRP